MAYESKDILKKCANTHHDVTSWKFERMNLNMKIWKSQEQNTIFPWNQKIINLSTNNAFSEVIIFLKRLYEVCEFCEIFPENSFYRSMLGNCF